MLRRAHSEGSHCPERTSTYRTPPAFTTGPV
jgi:hypothetical protein